MKNVSNLLYFILFADDTNIFYSNSDGQELVNTINSELANLADWFKANRLSLNAQKTSFMLFGYKRNPVFLDGSEFKIVMDDNKISQVEVTKFLGVLIDRKLTWQQHINSLSLKISKSLCIMSRLRNKLSSNCLLSLYYSLIYSHLNYCIILWGSASKTNLQKLIILQKRAVRIINKSHYLSHTDPIFKKYSLLKLCDIYSYFCIMFVYKYKFRLLPQVCNFFLTYANQNEQFYKFRAVDDFIIPRYRTSLRERCVTVRGPKKWNLLSADIRNCDSLLAFKSKIKQFFLEKYCNNIRQ